MSLQLASFQATSNLQPQILYQSAFGELLVAEVTGLIQLQFTYNLIPEMVTPSATTGGTVISSPPFALLSASPSSSASFQSNTSVHYKTGQGSAVLFTCAFTSGIANNQQYAGVGNTVNGFFFGYNGSTFGILYRNNSVDTWTYQVSWNQDGFNGTGPSGVTLDPTKGNLYKIQYQWLGFGNINFLIENPNTGTLSLVHQIKYPNSSTSTSLTNPTIPLYAINTSTNAAGTVQMKIPCMAAFLEGVFVDDNTRFGVMGSAFTATGLVLAIRNNLTYNNLTNTKLVQPDFSSLATTGANVSRFDYILNPTLAGTNYTPVNTSTGFSVVSFSTTATSITGGRVILSYYIAATSFDNIFLNDLAVLLNPGDVLAIQANISASTTVSATLSWFEQF